MKRIDFNKVEGVMLAPPATNEQIEKVQGALSKRFPDEYVLLLQNSNGFDADMFRLYPLEELFERNQAYEVDKYCPAYMTIGDDGGGSAVVLRHGRSPICEVFLVGHGVMTAEFMERLGNSLIEWIESGCPVET